MRRPRNIDHDLIVTILLVLVLALAPFLVQLIALHTALPDF